MVSSLVLWIGFGVPFLPLDRLWLTICFVLLAIGPVSIGVMVIARGRGWRGALSAVVAMGPYLAYTWLMWPVTFLGLYNLIRGKRGWVKTAREAIAAPEPTGGASA